MTHAMLILLVQGFTSMMISWRAETSPVILSKWRGGALERDALEERIAKRIMTIPGYLY